MQASVRWWGTDSGFGVIVETKVRPDDFVKVGEPRGPKAL